MLACTYFIKYTRLSSGVNFFISAKLNLPLEDILTVTLLATSLEEELGTESPINSTSFFQFKLIFDFDEAATFKLFDAPTVS